MVQYYFEHRNCFDRAGTSELVSEPNHWFEFSMSQIKWWEKQKADLESRMKIMDIFFISYCFLFNPCRLTSLFSLISHFSAEKIAY